MGPSPARSCGEVFRGQLRSNFGQGKLGLVYFACHGNARRYKSIQVVFGMPLSRTEPYFKSYQGLPIAKEAAKNGKDRSRKAGVELYGANSGAETTFAGNTGAPATPDPNVPKAAQKHVLLQCRPGWFC
jgi:hypothetical protein